MVATCSNLPTNQARRGFAAANREPQDNVTRQLTRTVSVRLCAIQTRMMIDEDMMI